MLPRPRLFLLLTFVCGLVAARPVAGQGVTPEACLKFKPGADHRLATYEQAIRCWEVLADSSPRMRIFEMGKTAMGRPMKYAVISSEANVKRLDEWRSISRRLSLTRGVSEAEAARLANEGRIVVWIDGGLHATECAPAQHLVQLAYDLVTADDAATRQIRDNVVTLLVFPNPDGMTLVADWYHPNVGTPYETSPMPWLYNKYAGHDNNRDAMHANLVETANLLRVQFQEWFPEIVLNHHQPGPFPARIFIPPYAEPTNPDVHPLIWRESNLIGTAMGLAFEAAGQTGVISRVSYDSFYPGYFTSITDSHNCPSILTEIALNRYATPRQYSVQDFPEAYRDLRPGRFYPSPWTGGWWRLGDAVAYALTASKSVLDVAARYRQEFLLNKYRMGTDAIARGRSKPPYGWIIPPDQHDAGAVRTMLEKLMLLGVEVHAADARFTDSGTTYPEGTWFVPASQPFGPFVREMFTRQDYPDLRKYPHLWQNAVGAPVQADDPLRPYDAAGWTLPLQFGVTTVEMSKPDIARGRRLEKLPPADGGVRGNGSRVVFSRDENRSFRALNLILAAGGKASWTLEPVTIDGQAFPPGAFVVERASLPAERLAEIAATTGVRMAAGTVTGRTRPLAPPRVGLYQSWLASMDEGWIRLILDEFECPFTRITDADIRAGNLGARFDAIVLPDQAPAAIVEGARRSTVPEQYAGGITAAGVLNLKRFVEDGGVLVCNGASSGLAIEHLQVPVVNSLQGASAREFSIPGSIVKMDYDTTHPLAYGMPKRGVAFFARSQVFRILPDVSGRPAPAVVARYPDEPLLLSGWQQGEERIRGQAAIVTAPVGKGRAVLFGFNVVNRYQTPSVVKLLLNALYDAGRQRQ